MKGWMLPIILFVSCLLCLLLLPSCEEDDEEESNYEDMGLSYHCIEVCNLTLAKWGSCVAEAEEQEEEFETVEDKLECVNRCKSDLDAHVALECYHDQCNDAECADYLDCRAECDEDEAGPSSS